MEQKLTMHDNEAIKALHKKSPFAWTLLEAKLFQTWAWEEDRNGIICAELIDIGYENCKAGLRNYNLGLRKKRAGTLEKWPKELLEKIMGMRRNENKNYKQIANELGLVHKVMYSALKRNGMLTDDVKRPLRRNKKKEDGFAIDAHLANIPWDTNNALFKKIVKAREDFGTLGRPN